MSANLCDLPDELLALILEQLIEAMKDHRNAKNFLTCSKRLWLSEVLSGHVAKLEVDLRQVTGCKKCALQERIMAFPSHGRAAVRTLVVRGAPRDNDNALAAALQRQDIARKLAQMHTLIVADCDVADIVPSLPWLANLLQREYIGLRELHITTKSAFLPSSPPSTVTVSPESESKLTTLKLHDRTHMNNTRFVLGLFPRLEVLELSARRIPVDSLERLTSLRVLVLKTCVWSMSTATMYDLLSGRLPNLTHLELLSVSSMPAPSDHPPPTPEASRISRLSIQSLNYGAIVHLLPLLPRLPHLTHLEVGAIYLHVDRIPETRANIRHLGPYPNYGQSIPLFLVLRKDDPMDDVDDYERMVRDLTYMDQVTRARCFRDMLELLRGSAFAESITAIMWDPAASGVPDVAKECAAIFPNVVELQWYGAIAEDFLEQSTLASLVAWPRLRSLYVPPRLSISPVEQVEDYYHVFLPALTFALGCGRRFRVVVVYDDLCMEIPKSYVTWKVVQERWDRYVRRFGADGCMVGVDVLIG